MLYMLILFVLLGVAFFSEKLFSIDPVVLGLDLKTSCIEGHSLRYKSIHVDRDIEIVTCLSDAAGQVLIEIECSQLKSLYTVRLRGKFKSLNWLAGDRVLSGGELCKLSGFFKIELATNVLSLSSKV